MSFIDVQIFSTSIGFKPNTLRISKKLGQVGTCDLEFERDSLLNVMVGQIITVYEDGARVFAGTVDKVTASLHSPAVYTKMTLNCVDNSAAAGRRAVPPMQWTRTPIGHIVQDVARLGLSGGDARDYITHVTVDPGLIVDTYATDYALVSDVLNDLVKVASALDPTGAPYYWYMDDDADLFFFPMGQYAAPIQIGVGLDTNFRADPECSGVLQVQVTREQLANQVIFRLGHYVTDSITELFDSGSGSQLPDSQRTIWTMQYSLNSAPTVAVNGDVKTVGVNGLDTGMDWYWNAGSPAISQDTGGTPLSPTDALQVTYVGQDTRVSIQQNSDSILTRQSVETQSGIYSIILDMTDAATSSQVDQIANAELSKRSALSVILTGMIQDQDLSAAGTLQQLKVGQTIYADPDQYSVSIDPVVGEGVSAAGTYLIRSIEMSDEKGAVLWRKLELVQGPTVYDSLEYLKVLLTKGPPSAGNTAQAIAPTTATFSFDAPQVGDHTNWPVIPKSGSPYQATISARGATASFVYLDIQYSHDNGSTWKSIFPDTAHVLVLTAGQHFGSKVTTFASHVSFAENDLIRAEILSGTGSDAIEVSGHVSWK